MGCKDKLEDMYINEKTNFDLVRRLEKYYFASLMDRDRLPKQIIPNLKVTLYMHSIINTYVGLLACYLEVVQSMYDAHQAL